MGSFPYRKAAVAVRIRTRNRQESPIRAELRRCLRKLGIAWCIAAGVINLPLFVLTVVAGAVMGLSAFVLYLWALIALAALSAVVLFFFLVFLVVIATENLASCVRGRRAHPTAGSRDSQPGEGDGKR